jgi:hypothetical protein
MTFHAEGVALYFFFWKLDNAIPLAIFLSPVQSDESTFHHQ